MLVACSASLGTASFTAPASAQSVPDAPTEPSAADKETARGLMDTGRIEYREGDYGAALEAFRGADEIMGVTSTGLWMGKALAKLGRLVQARDKLLQVARIPRGPDESPVLRQAREEAAALQLEIADRIPELKFHIDGLVEPAQPTIRVDGNEVPMATIHLPRKVDPGSHEIVATAPGHFDLKLNVTVAERDRQSVSLLFRPNGEPITPPPEPEPAPDAVGQRDDGLSGLMITTIVAGSVGAAGLLVGGITGGLSLAKASSAKEGCNDLGQCPADGNVDDRDASVTLAHVSTIGFVVGGVGAGVAAVALALELTGDDSTGDSAKVTPVVGPGFVGVQGSF